VGQQAMNNTQHQTATEAQKPSIWETARIGLLVTVLGGIAVCLGQSLVVNQFGKSFSKIPLTAALNFPAVVPLPQWQFERGSAIVEREIKRTDRVAANKPNRSRTALITESYPVISGYQYHYKQGNQTLTIEMRYLTHHSPINVSDLLNAHPSQNFSRYQPTIMIREKSGIGFHGLFTMQNQAYLSSCINSGGTSTFSSNQIARTPMSYDVFLPRLWSWLLNQSQLSDPRCLWVHLSTPVQSSPEAAYQSLEQVWQAWYPEWQVRFPNL
jgi:cyanosortase A-associated protein